MAGLQKLGSRGNRGVCVPLRCLSDEEICRELLVSTGLGMKVLNSLWAFLA